MTWFSWGRRHAAAYSIGSWGVGVRPIGVAASTSISSARVAATAAESSTPPSSRVSQQSVVSDVQPSAWPRRFRPPNRRGEIGRSGTEGLRDGAQRLERSFELGLVAVVDGPIARGRLDRIAG
jgi:hypothetical protein